MAVTATDIVNQAILMMGDNQPLVQGNAPNFDDSAAGIAAKYLYTPCVQAIGRKYGFDFERNTVALTPSGNVAPFPWAREYLYPPNGVQVWQLVRPAAVTDPNNPLPVNWVIANSVVAAVQQRVIHTDIADAFAIYNNAPNENTWDSLFRDAVVRMLMSEFAIALAGKPETSQIAMQSAAAMAAIAESRDS